MLTSAVRLLPTPLARDGQNSRSARDPRPRIAAGHGAMLDEAVMHLLPTPTATDARGARNHTSGRTAGSAHHDGWTLTDALLPTPSKADADGGHATRSGPRSTEMLLPGVARAVAAGPATAPRCTDGKASPTDPFPTQLSLPLEGGGGYPPG